MPLITHVPKRLGAGTVVGEAFGRSADKPLITTVS